MTAWQFRIDGRPAAPVRADKVDAFSDAVKQGYASWASGRRDAIRMDSSGGGEIVKVEKPHD